MLTEENLLVQDTKPNLKDVSLKLYKDFSINRLFTKRFHYYFTDGTDIVLEFREWGIYHMLAVQHIDYVVKKDNFFTKIDNGLELSDFERDDAIKDRFKRYKERIALFSCLYYTLKNGETFYIPNQNVPNTKDVKCDYIIYQQIGSKGMNVGLKYSEGCFIPMTNLISRPIKLDKYIDTALMKKVKKLIISDISSGVVVEEIIKVTGSDSTKDQ